ncbi:MAG TPA: limonene-1,2-epoxide hydrolase family protein [Caulobacteraceae bacterium]|nr:limonene-1,2-epoxide hydrolase family protein [Caulobacteraceae bacterium]
MSNSQIVLDFIAAWEARDVERIVGMMTADARYLNVGLPEAVGHDQIRAMVTPFLGGAKAVRWTVRHIAETAGGAVLTERTDDFELADRMLSIPVMGVFELKDGKIAAWRDYFDVPAFQAQMA